MTVVIAPSPSGYNSTPRADFKPGDFDTLIWQKGYDVIHEIALLCPCKSKNTNQLSNCKNCGGSGWSYINPTETRMVLSSMNRNTKYKEWSEVNIGSVSVSCMSSSGVSFMDRITVKDGEAIHHEVRYSRKSASNKLFFYTTYKLKEIIYIALFVDENTAYNRLTHETDFTFRDNIVELDDSFLDEYIDDQEISLVIRYKYAPQYHVIDMPRETIATNVIEGGVERIGVQLPIHAIAKKAHNIPDIENFEGTRMIDNSFDTTCVINPKIDC